MGGIRKLDRYLDNLEQDLGEAVAKHREARDPTEFEKYAGRPVGFITEVLNEQDPGPWEAQREVARAVRDHPLVAVRSCNSAGKDWIAARLALWWVYARRGLVLLTGPTERQVREIVMGEVTRAFHKAEDLLGELYSMALRVSPEAQAGILAFTSNEASKITGFHGPRVFAVLTEAQGVEDFAYEGMLSCATGPEDRVLAVGNPLSPQGRFYDASQESSEWHDLQISAEDHPNVEQDEEVIPGAVSSAFVQRMAGEYGEDSPVYRARVEGEFPDHADEGLCRRVWIEEAQERHAARAKHDEHDEQEEEDEREDEIRAVAVDPARHGPDDTVIAVRRGPVIERLEIFSGATDTTEITGHVRRLLDEEGFRTKQQFYEEHEGEETPDISDLERVVVDEVGVGGGVADQLQEQEFNVAPYNGGSKPSQRERFRDVRAESYWRVRRLLEEGDIALPPDEKLAEELRRIRWSPTSGGKLRLEAKHEFKNRVGRSPDRADACVMCLYSEHLEPSFNWVLAAGGSFV